MTSLRPSHTNCSVAGYFLEKPAREVVLSVLSKELKVENDAVCRHGNHSINIRWETGSWMLQHNMTRNNTNEQTTTGLETMDV